MERPHDNLYSKTQLRKMGLIPVGKVIKTVKGEWGWFNLYNPDETRPVRKATPTQLTALEKARAAKVQKEKERREEERQRELEEEREWHEKFREDRNDAILWARRKLEQPERFVILDVETTGLEYDDEICSIGILRGDGQPMFQSLVKPSRDMPAPVIAIHGITNEAVVGAPKFMEVWPGILEAIGDRELVIYNWSFDIAMMQSSLRKRGLELDLVHYKEVAVQQEDGPNEVKRQRFFINGKRVFCAMRLYAKYVNDWSHYHGGYRWQPLCGNHDALGDCQAVLKLMTTMAGADLDA
jgi:DNA polymerase III subunit epsilon